MNLLKTSSLLIFSVTLISLAISACKKEENPEPQKNTPTVTNTNPNNTGNNGGELIYDQSDSSKVIGHTLSLADSSELYIKITNGFDTTRTFQMIGGGDKNLYDSPGPSKELKPGESYVFHFNKEKNGLPWIIQFVLMDGSTPLESSAKTQFVLREKGVTWGNYYEFVVDIFLPYFD